MKKGLKIITIFTLLLTTIFTLSSCSKDKECDYINPIAFGKKYMLDENRYYIFNDDQTGVLVYYYEYSSTISSKYDFTISGQVDFIWREASNGAVYLFEVETHLNEDHTYTGGIPVIDEAIYFGEDFFIYNYTSELGSSCEFFVKEGSKLESVLKD